jgi:hypothetical protein
LGLLGLRRVPDRACGRRILIASKVTKQGSSNLGAHHKA